MAAIVPLEDRVIWFKHVQDPALRKRLNALSEDEMIFLSADGVVGRWKRMKQGKNPTPTEGIKPEGSMGRIWTEWFRTRKGEPIEIREVRLADEHLADASLLFPEWSSPEDEDAFRDL